jgi:hypothetical protein
VNARTLFASSVFVAGAALVVVSLPTGADRPAMSTPAPLGECATLITTTDARTGAVMARLCEPLIVVRTDIGTAVSVTR